MDWLEYGVLFAVAAVVTIALTPLARKLAIKLDAIDYPSARRVNMLPIPRMGGVAIFGGILALDFVLHDRVHAHRKKGEFYEEKYVKRCLYFSGICINSRYVFCL